MSQTNSKNTRDAIKAFISHVESLENAENPDDNSAFEAEYKLIQEAQTNNRRDNVFPMDVGKKLNNVKKNRYKDILPYDEHRVVLSVVDEDQDSDYINASKLMGVRGTGGYIATQGPLAITVNDFWRMIWEYNVEIIFMACKIVEVGKIKCKQYWNDAGKSDEFGDITVMTEAEADIMFDCKRRNFQVTRGEEVRHVVQFHYSGWPDHGIPDDAGHIRDMIGIMRQTRHNQQAPLLVHCSAGCGRSGAIITIDYVWTLLEEGKFDDTFKLFYLICNFREQRMSIVQTADQYAFLNKVLKSLCEEWLTRIASHTYENVDVDQTGDVDYQNTDASKSVSGEQIYEDKLASGNHVHDVVSGLNRERNPTAEQKHVSEEALVSPSKRKLAQLTSYENVLQNKGTNENQTEKGSHKTVIKVESGSKLGSPGSKKAQAPSPPSSPLGSDTKGGFKQHLAQTCQNPAPLPSSVLTSPAIASKPHQPTVNGTPDEPIYTVVNKSLKHQTSGSPNYSTVNKQTPTSPTVFHFATVLPASEDHKSADNKKVSKASIPPPHPTKQAAISTDHFGYSSIDSSLPNKSPTSVPTLYSHLHQTNPSPTAKPTPIIPTDNFGYSSIDSCHPNKSPASGPAVYGHLHQADPSPTAKPTPVPTDNFGYSSIDSCLPNKSPASGPGVYAHLHQTDPSPAVGGANYCSIGDMNSGSTVYEDVRLQTAVNKPTVPVVMHGRRQSNNSCLNLGQVNSYGIPGFNQRLPRVRGPVPMPQSWTKI